MCLYFCSYRVGMDVLLCNIHPNGYQHWNWNRSNFTCGAVPWGMVTGHTSGLKCLFLIIYTTSCVHCQEKVGFTWELDVVLELVGDKLAVITNVVHMSMWTYVCTRYGLLNWVILVNFSTADEIIKVPKEDLLRVDFGLKCDFLWERKRIYFRTKFVCFLLLLFFFSFSFWYFLVTLKIFSRVFLGCQRSSIRAFLHMGLWNCTSS